LAIACATGADIDVIRLLLDPPGGLDHGGGAVTIPDSRGCTPLSELTTHYELQRKSPWLARTSKPLDEIQFHDLYNNGNGLDIEGSFHSFWIKVELLVKAAWFHANQKNNFNNPGSFVSMVHGTTFIAETCPEVLSSLIGRLFPSMASVVDRYGLLPLHYLVTVSTNKNCQTTTVTNFIFDQRRTMWIKLLLGLYPDAASMKLNNRRSVLCQAIASGLHWHIIERRHTATRQQQQSSTMPMESSNSSQYEESMIGPVQFIWRACPELLCQKDVYTGLYPFMLAAWSSKNSTDVLEVEDGEVNDLERQQVDTIYGLIRSHPQLLSELLMK
jgi:hypothetical protein